jgi:hypothetical protein
MPLALLAFLVGAPGSSIKGFPTIPAPRIIVSDNPYDWLINYLPTAVGFVQFLLLFFLTVYTFRNAAIQKVAEREATWYHKVVVDFSISSVTNFVEQSIPLLESMLREAEQNPSYNLKVRDGISKFKSRLSRLLDGLQRRIECFPGNPSIRVGNLALGRL